MTALQAQVESIAAACGVTSPFGFSWFGAPTTAVPPTLRTLPAPEQRQYLLAALTERIYQDAFCVGGPRPTPAAGDQLLPGRDRHFAAALAEANASQGAWESGWTVFEAADDAVGVVSGELSLWIHPRDLSPSVNGAGHAPGDVVSIRMPSGSQDLSPGYYCAFSDVPATALAGSAQIVRVYLALTPAGAAPAMRSLTANLNQARVPFRFKMLAAPASYSRSDSAVLYLAVEDLHRASGPLAAVITGLRPHLRATVPMFTYPLARGVGVAEEPAASQQSFGQHRSGLVAEGLVRASEVATSSTAEKVRCIADAVTAAGVDISSPFVTDPRSADRYTAWIAGLDADPLPAAAARLRPDAPAAVSSMRAADPGVEDPTFLAERVGAQLVDQAFWHGDRCTWLSVVVTTDGTGQPTVAHGVIGPDLYDGVAGVAVYLALLAATSGSHEALDTALGAARQAVRMCGSGADGLGLYIGRIGRAVATATTAVIADDVDLLQQAGEPLLTGGGAYAGPDLLMGHAGAVLGFLTLTDLCRDERFLDRAARAGDALVATARRGRQGWSWAIPGGGSGPHLTGLSHGASGIAVALLELGARTGEARFTAAGAAALDYERHWFDPGRGNWPDLRDVVDRRARPRVFLSQWCHGAPGIALARLRAVELTGDPRLEQEAVVALETTLRDTRAALFSGALSFSLCHGIAGNIQVLLEGQDLLGEQDHASVRSLVAEFQQVAASRRRGGRPWPCGVPVPDIEVPGLLLGTSGIGYHFLRQGAPDVVPSLLLLRPARFAAQVHALAGAAGSTTLFETIGGRHDGLRES